MWWWPLMLDVLSNYIDELVLVLPAMEAMDTFPFCSMTPPLTIYIEGFPVKCPLRFNK